MQRYIAKNISHSYAKRSCVALLISVALLFSACTQSQPHNQVQTQKQQVSAQVAVDDTQQKTIVDNVSNTNNIGYIELESFNDFDFQTVNDFTQTLSPSEISLLDKKIRSIYKDNIMQIGIVIVPTTADKSIFDYAMAVANSWKLGSAEDNNGLLILIAKDDQQIYILTGKGIETSLRDEEVARIIRTDIIPQFAKENYYAGLSVGIDALVRDLHH